MQSQINIDPTDNSPYIIVMKTNVALSGPLLPMNITLAGVPLNRNVTVTTMGLPSPVEITGGGPGNIFFIVGGTVTLRELILTQGTSQGGNGGDGGGGALGAGGAVFVNQAANCTIDNCLVQFCSAIGGTGTLGTHGGGGGGGMLQGNGGPSLTESMVSGSGGGGLPIPGSSSGTGLAGTTLIGGTGGGFSPGTGGAAGMPGAPGNNPTVGTVGGGGGGGGVNNSGTPGAPGGAGGMGSDFGGGGGGGFGVSFAIGSGSGGTGGTGGWGGGGGSCGAFNNDPVGGTAPGGIGGGAGFSGTNSKPGGGSAWGGGVFVRQGGTLTCFDTVQVTDNSITGGPGTPPGASAGSDLYLDTGVDARFQTGAGILGNIAGPGSITVAGSVGMRFASNQYMGGTTIESGAIQIISSATSPGPLGTGPVTFTGSGQIEFFNSFTSPNLPFEPPAIDIVTFTATFNAEDFTSDIQTAITGTGTVAITSAAPGFGVISLLGDSHTQTWQTQIQQGTLSINTNSLGTGAITFTGAGILQFQTPVRLQFLIVPSPFPELPRRLMEMAQHLRSLEILAALVLRVL